MRHWGIAALSERYFGNAWVPILDFQELAQARGRTVQGETLENLVRELGNRLGLAAEWTGRGADQGRDLTFTETRVGSIGSNSIKWLVSCKDHASSGRSVTEGDIGTVLEKLEQHRANAFLVVTTTTVSSGLKSMLDGLNSSGKCPTRVWDRQELESLLLREPHLDIVKNFMPASYLRYMSLGGLPQAINSMQVLVPDFVYIKIIEIINTYKVGDVWLNGERIWPHDKVSSESINLAFGELLEKKDSEAAATILVDGNVEYDAFEGMLKVLHMFRPGEAEELCRAIVKKSDPDGRSLTAFKFLIDNYEPDNREQMLLAINLRPDDLRHLYGEEVHIFINETITSDPARFSAWSDIDILSTHSTLEEVYADDIEFKADVMAIRITFSTTVNVSVGLSYGDDDTESSASFPGSVSGYIDETGMFIEQFVVDTDFHFS